MRARLLWSFAALALVVAAGAYVARRDGAGPAGPLPVFYAVDDFSLLERSGRTVRLADLEGKVWIADFVFTRCPGPCPILTREMGRLAVALPEEVRFVSFSVDPEFDTPEVLTTYADACGADANRWLFLTGTKDAVWDLVRDGFRLTVEPEAAGVLHSLRFVLVDRSGRVRGVYTGNDEADLARLRRDARRLLAEPPA